jgi:hypothetical protein
MRGKHPAFQVPLLIGQAQNGDLGPASPKSWWSQPPSGPSR